MRTRVGLVGLFTVIFFISFTSISFTAGKEISVTDSDSLHQALKQASAGDTIILEDGEYHGNFTIEASIVLKGKGEAHIKGLDKGYPILIEADDVTVENLHVEGGGTDAAGIFSRGDRNQILNNKIRNVFHGVLVRDGYGNVISGNNISSWDELIGSRRYGYAMYVINGDGAIITNNQTYNTQDGVWVSHTSSAQVSYNRFINARYGIHTMYAKNIAITHNEVRGSYNGGMIMQSKEITIKYNYFHLNTLSDGTGVFGFDLFDSVISENIIKGNSKGIFLGFAQRNEIYKNQITENVRGIELGEGALNNWIFLNNLTKNTQQVVTNPENENDFNVDGYGNFWDDQRIVDLENDGINDFAYKSGDVFYQMSERDPFLHIFFESPAVRLWNTIEQYTHIPSDTFIIDEYSLSEPVIITQQVEVFQPHGNHMGFTHPALLLSLFVSVISISFITLYLTRRRTI
ncbi:nitrous oxide reductase family maturation protein NosD [Anaerobacillus sp. MEB173]|uniref:right-handed parallel beta-helix repeat-containing protein n=1 Tax=Anaerobacillus sp. MEB173 TaxID=3383345 RepID=UPI003F916399